MKELLGVIGGVGAIVAILIAVCLVQPLFIYCLWDETMVKFFHVQDVTFWDSVWISIICNVLFKSTNYK